MDEAGSAVEAEKGATEERAGEMTRRRAVWSVRSARCVKDVPHVRTVLRVKTDLRVKRVLHESLENPGRDGRGSPVNVADLIGAVQKTMLLGM